MTTMIQLFYDIVIPDSNKTKNILSIIILIFISLSFAMYGIEVGEPHVDIYQLRGVFEKTWYELISDFSTPSGLYGGFHAPIYFLLGKAWGSIFGNDVIQFRIFSVVAHVLLVVVSWVKFPTISLNKNIFSRFLFSMLISIFSTPFLGYWFGNRRSTLVSVRVNCASIIHSACGEKVNENEFFVKRWFEEQLLTRARHEGTRHRRCRLHWLAFG